jgi:hypothetical protein
LAEASRQESVKGCAGAVALLLVVGIGTLALGFKPVGSSATALSLMLLGVVAWRQGRFSLALGPSLDRQHAPVRFWTLLAVVMLAAVAASVAAYRSVSEALGG